MSERRPWSRNEIILAIDLYCRTRFGRIHNKNPEIVALAHRLGRTPNSVALKMANFANLDVTIERKGMQNSSKLDREIWAEFFADPDVFWTGLAAQAETYPFPMGQDQIEFGFREGLDYVVSAKARKNQDYFRDMILATYDDKCCITGIALPDLLVASHIVPWSQNRKLRTDPRNGLCLNALHDKAFDRGFISLDTDYRLIVGSKLKRFKYPIFNTHEGKKISLPKRFRPSQDCLEEHRKMHRQTLR